MLQKKYLGPLFWILLALGANPMMAQSPNMLDLTHAFDSQTPYWPTEEGFKLEKEFEGKTEKGYFYASNKFCAAEHGGTHLDAPYHFYEKGWKVDEIPLSSLQGPGVLVDVTAQARKNRDYQITVEDFQNWEKQHGSIPEGAIILLNTGFAKYWPDRKNYLGTDLRGKAGVAQLHFPGLHPQAASWLVKNRRIAAVGLDTASIDFGQSKLFETHRILFEKNILAFENLADLSSLPPKGFEIIALPMKIGGGSGAPLRIVAKMP